MTRCEGGAARGVRSLPGAGTDRTVQHRGGATLGRLCEGPAARRAAVAEGALPVLRAALPQRRGGPQLPAGVAPAPVVVTRDVVPPVMNPSSGPSVGCVGWPTARVVCSWSRSCVPSNKLLLFVLPSFLV